MPQVLRETLADAARQLADQGVLLGTSSWKYPGWLGMIYDEQQYLYRGKVAKTRFEKGCLAEYAQVFKSVCVDAGYYSFPTGKYLHGLVSQVPDDFKFAFKVTDEITIRKFPHLPRHGDRAGKLNEHFLDPEIFQRAFLAPCEPFRKNIGVLMFEFSRFYPGDFDCGRDFVERLDGFLGSLPKAGWQYGVEIRNRSFLEAGYFEMLRRHGVTHVFNNWTRMPPVEEQLDVEGSMTADFAAARFLLKAGRNYQQAVDSFQPYDKTKEVNESARQAGASLIRRLIDAHAPRKKSQRASFLFVNNRLEGNALLTLAAMAKYAGIG